MKHGVYASQKETSAGTPEVSSSGIAFVIGTAPVQSAQSPASSGSPVLCTSWNEAVAALGYSEDWEKYSLCEFMYSHFQLFGCQPVIFCNLLDPQKMKTAVPAQDLPANDHKILLPLEAIDDDTLIVKEAGGTGEAAVRDVDYTVYYDGENCVIETLDSGALHTAESLNVAYSAAEPGKVTSSVVAAGLESIEYCMGITGLVPDLIAAPGFSGDAAVAAVMATKAAGINGMFKAKALIDIDTASADEYSRAIAAKEENHFADENEIICWPMLQLGGRKFHMSTQLAGLMAQVDTENNGCPYESPSNKAYISDAVVLKDGSQVLLTHAQANLLNAAGIVTALGFMGSLVCWGNYTACYPESTDIKDYYIPVTRMFDWVGNSEIMTFWSKIDKSMSRRLIDSVLDTVNIWLNGLVGMGYLLGGRAEFSDEENPVADLQEGIIRIHNYIAPPSPAQEIEFILEYDVSYVTSALQG